MEHRHAEPGGRASAIASGAQKLRDVASRLERALGRLAAGDAATTGESDPPNVAGELNDASHSLT